MEEGCCLRSQRINNFNEGNHTAAFLRNTDMETNLRTQRIRRKFDDVNSMTGLLVIRGKNVFSVNSFIDGCQGGALSLKYCPGH